MKWFACVGAVVCVVGVSACSSGANAPIPVGQAAAHTGTFSSGYATVGVVQPQIQVDVVPTYTGHVLATYKQVGDKVEEGDKLLQIDTKTIDNQIDVAIAGLDQADAAVSAAGTNVQQANTGLDKANQGVNQANAALAGAKAGQSTTTSGTNQAALVGYQAAVANASIAYSSAQQGQAGAQAALDATQAQFDAGLATQDDLNTAKATLAQANAVLASAKVARDTANKNLAIFTSVTSKQAAAAAQANVDAAKAGVGAAKVGVSSAKAAIGTAKAGVNSSKAAYNTSETQLNNLQKQKADYTVKSPIAGVVLAKNAIAGGNQGATAAYTVGNVDKVLITTAVPKSELDKLVLGGQGEVFFPDGTSVLTNVTALASTPNSANLYLVQLLVDNASGALKPGTDANVVFVEKQFQSLIVPIAAVVTSGKDAYVFVADNGRARKIPVTVTGRNTNEAAIDVEKGALTDGAQVVTKNAALLGDGDAISEQA